MQRDRLMHYRQESLEKAILKLHGHYGFADLKAACFIEERYLYAATPSSYHREAKEELLRVGCAARSLTATLIAQACSEGLLSLDEPVADILARHGVPEDKNCALGQTKLLHLLSNTHGLDSSGAAALAYRDDGSISRDALLNQLRAMPRITEPGTLFEYSALGTQCLTLILELIYGLPYAVILHNNLFRKLKITAYVDGTRLTDIVDLGSECWSILRDVNPAFGGALELSTQDMLRVLLYYLPKSPVIDKGDELELSLASLIRTSIQLGNWLPMANIHLGWNGYGDGWYGVNGNSRHGSIVLRFNPLTRSCIVISSKLAHAAHMAMSELFPGIPSKEYPRSLSTHEWGAMDIAKFVGVFGNNEFRLVFDLTRNSTLRAMVYRKQTSDEITDESNDPYIKRHLRPAVENIFLPDPGDPSILRFVQFLEQASDGTFRCVHNGWNTFVRV